MATPRVTKAAPSSSSLCSGREGKDGAMCPLHLLPTSSCAHNQPLPPPGTWQMGAHPVGFYQRGRAC